MIYNQDNYKDLAQKKEIFYLGLNRDERGGRQTAHEAYQWHLHDSDLRQEVDGAVFPGQGRLGEGECAGPKVSGNGRAGPQSRTAGAGGHQTSCDGEGGTAVTRCGEDGSAWSQDPKIVKRLEAVSKIAFFLQRRLGSAEFRGY